MLGILIYAYFLFMGFLYADMLFKNRDLYFKIWFGGIFGNVILMTGMLPVAMIFDFTYLSHIILIVLTAVPYAVLYLRGRNKISAGIPRLKKGSEKNKTAEAIENSGMTHKIFLLLILPVTLIICLLMTNHIYAPVDGGVASGQCTYGDLAIHSGMITSFAEQGTFPPNYNILSGTKLCYPFLINLLSSSLYLFGLPLRWAILLPSYVFAFLLVIGFYFMSYKATGRKTVSILATLMFFFNGGFGFAYFFEGAKADSTAFTKIFTEYYQTPTNYNDHNIRWANTICDMIIPQRTTMAGWCMLMPAFWLLIDAIKTKRTRAFIIIGVFAGCLPMIHTHSFMAFGIVCAVMFFLYLIDEKSVDEKKQYVKNWVIFGAITIVMAMPQLIFWTFQQASEGSFLKFKYDWVNENDPFLWFWIKNWGIVFLALIPAFLNAERGMKRFMLAGLVVFIIADLFQFQPLDYDNNKIFFVAYMIAVVAAAEFFVRIYERMNEIKGREVMAVMVGICLFTSGILTIGREFNSGAEYQTFSDADMEFAEFVKENTDPHAVFATNTGHLNSVYVLAGRTIFVGPNNFIWTHGIGSEYTNRESVLRELYESGSITELKSIAEENNIKYILYGPAEKSEYNINQNVFNQLNRIYDENGTELYEIQ